MSEANQETVYVIGMGEVGTRLARALEAAGRKVAPVTRHEGWEEALDDGGALRILAMREDDLPAAFHRFPESQRSHLVLVQNGFLEAVLGDLGPVNRGLIWFTSKGDFFEVLRPSPFYGPRAEGLAGDLAAGGLPVEAPGSPEEQTREMILKGLWNCVVGLPLAVHGVDLATYMRDHRQELTDLLEEGARAASARYAVAVTGAQALARLEETTSPLGWVTGGAKALAWRNGAIARFGREHGIPTPVTDGLLEAAG